MTGGPYSPLAPAQDSMAGGGTRVKYADFSAYFRRVAAACLAAEKEEVWKNVLGVSTGSLGGLAGLILESCLKRKHKKTFHNCLPSRSV